MGSLGSKPVPLKDQIRENKRSLDRAIREIDRERLKLERQQTRIQNDIRKAAKTGQQGPVRIMAKDYVRTKKQIEKMMQMRAQLQGIGFKLTGMGSTEAMTQAMKNATRIMGVMSKRMQSQELQKIFMQFAQQNEKMDMMEEMMGDAIDDAMSDDEAEEDEIVNQVFEELKIDMFSDQTPSGPVGSQTAASGGKQAVAAGPASSPGHDDNSGGNGGGGAGGPPPAAPPAGGGGGGGVSDLEARLQNLRK